MVGVYRRFNLAHHDELAHLIPGVREALSALDAAGVPLAVVSSKIRGVVLRGLNLFDLERYFRTVVCLEDTERHKPDPAPVALAAARLKVALRAALMVGDSPADLQAGRRAGCATAAVAWSANPAEALAAEAPDHVLKTMAEVLPLCGVA
jgi:pyrophosphatase PpaX